MTARVVYLWQLIVLVSCLCAPGTAFAGDPIRLWHAWRDGEEQALANTLATWDGEVQVLAIPYDAFAAKLGSAIPFGEGPDLFVDSHARLGDYLARGLVAPVGDADLSDQVVTLARDAVVIDGIAYGIPLSLKSLALYVNDELVSANIDSLEDIAAVAPTLSTGTFALVYEAQNAYAHAPFLHAFGGRMVDEHDQFAFVGPEAEQSLRYVASLIHRGLVPADADGALVTSLFRGGKAAAAISGPWLAAELGTGGPLYHVLPLPPLAPGGPILRPYLTVEAVMLSPQGASRSEVRALARHLGSGPAALTRASLGRAVSARRDFLDSDQVISAFANQAQRAVVMPSSTAMQSAWEPAHRAIRKVLRGDLPAADALNQARYRFELAQATSPTPLAPRATLWCLAAASLLGAIGLLRRARTPDFRRRLRRSWPAYGYVAHAAVAIAVLVAFPLVVGAATSLFATTGREIQYVGLANFVRILTASGGDLLASGSFYLVLLVTLLWTLVNVAMHLGLGLALGMLLAKPALRLRSFYRIALIVPWAVPNYVTALAWKGMFHRQFGAVTGAILAVNKWLGTDIEPISWFSRFSTAFAANCATNIWLGFPFMMVVTMAAMTNVPREVAEAAALDGASRWQRLRHITLPMIRPSLIPAVTLGAIWTFNMFNVVFLVSGGEPDGTTDILVSEAYRWAFTREAQYGYAAAYAVLIFVLLAGATRFLEWMGAGPPRRRMGRGS